MSYFVGRLLSGVLFYWLTIHLRIRNWWRVRILHRHESYQMQGDPRGIEGVVAVVALHPRIELKQSVERLLTSLKEQNVSIVAVVNESPAAVDYRDLLDRLATVTLYRPNIGRDFGAYQAGYRFLLKEGAESRVDRVIFANDSVLYPPGCEIPIKELVTAQSQALGLWISLDVAPHIQTFLFGLSAETAFSIRVKNFWAAYYPTAFKKSAVSRGEIGLSRAISSSGAPLECLTKDEYLFGPEFSGLARKFLFDEVVALRKKCFVESTQDAYAQSIRDQLSSEADQGVQIRLMARIALSTRNASHALGLYATRIHRLPLKLDLVKAGTCSLDTYCQILRLSELPPDEVLRVRNLLARQGSETSVTGIRKLLRQHGYDN